MDYDSTDIPDGYDRGRDHGPKNLQLWMNVIESFVGDQRLNTILDLGCGTGRFTESLAVHFDAEVVGIDPSKKMLDRAQKKRRDGRVRYELGRAEAIPLPDDSIDLVFMSMSFHHFDDPVKAARECRRVLRDGAAAIVRTGVRERIPSYPYVEFFPESHPILENVLFSEQFLSVVFQAVGFRAASSEIVIQEIAPNYAAYAEKLAAGADSVLAQLSPDAFQRGLEAIRAYAATAGDKPVSEPIDVFVFR